MSNKLLLGVVFNLIIALLILAALWLLGFKVNDALIIVAALVTLAINLGYVFNERLKGL